MDCLQPKSPPVIVKADIMFDEKDNPIDVAPHPMSIIKIPYEKPIKVGSLLRMKT